MSYRIGREQTIGGGRLDALLRTTCDVIARRGLAKTRTADVAAAAGVSQRWSSTTSRPRTSCRRAFEYAAGQDLARVEVVVRSSAAPVRSCAAS